MSTILEKKWGQERAEEEGVGWLRYDTKEVPVEKCPRLRLKKTSMRYRRLSTSYLVPPVS